MPARLVLISGNASQRVFDLPGQQAATLGRHSTNALVLRDEHASRHHARIYFEEGDWWIAEIKQPRNGTQVNGEWLQQPTRLSEGAEIRIGETRLRFTLQDPAPEPSGLSSSALSLPRTPLPADELNALFTFIVAAAEMDDAHQIIEKALTQILRQTRATLVGFLNFDGEDPLPRVVLPAHAAVDAALSRHLTQLSQAAGRTIWLAEQAPLTNPSESLGAFTDALCVPVRASGSPLGALHVYKAAHRFTERERRFCEVLVAILARGLYLLRAQRTLEAENSRLRSHQAIPDQLIGSSPAIQELRRQIAQLAPLPVTVLIRGESGVGKELVAQGLHQQSHRRDNPLVAASCAAFAASLSDGELFGHQKGAFTGAGLFQQADQGSLFLDEVGELSPEMQGKLLRVLETRSFRPVGATGEVKVDVRIIAATNRDLDADVAAGRFRADLLYRLKVVEVKVPPLREHPEDIPALVAHFLALLAREYRRPLCLTEAALARLQGHAWPGNVRQLKAVLESAVALADPTRTELDVAALPLPTDRPAAGGGTLHLEEVEAATIREALRQTQGNVLQATKLLGIARDTLTNKIRKYGIDRHQP
jgi:two-component system response regulator HydG